MQSKLQSAFESLTNVVFGYVIALLTQLIMFPFFNIHISIGENILMTGIFTVVSLARSYLVRRWFNGKIE